ncbi:negative regulator of flagellin synthesis FlgM [Sporomusaceae bacterium BoRhaA]|uniref:flagellar biosynthesis anti-sigma factor FlgM n=1 Tax=Pelorhabdus rhamnosifermentans TaxID=2772457 RepID=UPI001C064030|nr:flagellar biosynthesis anti-sigma factor FlgM [Pelorhabdus rhamnosifermentans]MBU2699142.1 negative regulator of flagellin synthesis FlgM [Pelorhabdus rhamnosifermentans]
MIISTNQIQQATKVYGDTQKALKTAKKDSKTVQTQGSDEVILSTNAQEFGDLLRKLQALPDVRETKVQVLQDQVAQGTYKVDSYAIADKITAASHFDRQG